MPHVLHELWQKESNSGQVHTGSVIVTGSKYLCFEYIMWIFTVYTHNYVIPSHIKLFL